MRGAPSTFLTIPLLHRICSEFAEMPGLQLTRQQAQRLWGLDDETCARALQLLVEAKFLREGAEGRYARASEGRAVYPPSRMIEASLKSGALPMHGPRTAVART
jgi:hypothetical protein